MSEMPMFDNEYEGPEPAANTPKKPRQKPTRKRKARKAVAAPTPKKRRAKKRRVAKRVKAPAAPGMNHAEFEAAWDVFAMLKKFDNDAKKRILAKAAEAWT